MANYTKATNFAAKDGLPTGNAGKIVKGTEIDTEFTAIASAIASKADLNSPALTGSPTAPTASAGTNTTQIATTAFVTTALEGTGGRIVQVVDSVTTTGVDSSSDSLVGTGHTASITPTSASNKILIMMSFGFAQTNINASNGTNAFWSLYRGGTNLGSPGAGFGVNCLGMAAVNTTNNTSSVYIQESYQLLDSPNTTSSVTYQTYVRRSGNATAGYNTMGNARIILLEIEQ